MSPLRDASAVLGFFALSFYSLTAAAVPAPPGDSGASGPNATEGAGEADEQAEKPFWAGSSVAWSQSASGDTVGLGQDFQSKNPSYEWTLSLNPVFTLYDDKPLRLSLNGDLSTFREFTNSDGTTREGEWELGDAQAGIAASLLLSKNGLYRTSLSLRAPTLTFPTSQASANNGKRLGIGTSLTLSQTFPLRGEDSDSFKSFSIAGSVGYSHTITEAVVPTNPDLQRIRLTPDGQSLPSDQLGAAAFAQHRASFTLSVSAAASDRISLDAGFTWSPVWKYRFDNDIEVCTVVTGCVVPERTPNPQNVNLIAGFTAGVGVQVFDAMSLALGYSNVTLQLGPDGQRRQPFYSPAARVSLSVSATLDELYKLARTDETPALASGSRQRLNVAAR